MTEISSSQQPPASLLLGKATAAVRQSQQCLPVGVLESF